MRLLVRFMGFLFAAGTVVFLVASPYRGADLDFPRTCRNIRSFRIMSRGDDARPCLGWRAAREYSKERRLYLPIQAVPKMVINAFWRRGQELLRARRHRFAGWARGVLSRKITAPTAVRRAHPRYQQVARTFF